MADIEIPFYISYAVLWALAVFEGLVIVGLVRTVASGGAQASAPRRNGIDLTGSKLPDFAGRNLRGDVFDSRQIAGRPAALLFVSAECSTCAVTLEEFDALNARMDGNVVVFCRSTHTGCSKLAERYRLGSMVIEDTDGVVGDLLRVEITPTAILVGPDGVIASYGHPMSPGELDGQVEALQEDGRLSRDQILGVIPVTHHGGSGAAVAPSHAEVTRSVTAERVSDQRS